MCGDESEEVEAAEKETATECMLSPCVRGEPASNTLGRSLAEETRYRLFEEELGKFKPLVKLKGLFISNLS